MSLPIEVAFYGAQVKPAAPEPIEFDKPAPIIDLTQAVKPAPPEPVKKDDVVVKKKDDEVKKPEPPKENTEPAKKPDDDNKEASSAPTEPEEAPSVPFSNVMLENKDFRYPFYLRGIQNRVNQNWQWVKTYGKLRAVVYFRVAKDGSVSGIRLSESSRDESFDKAALRAIERAGRFAPLPEGFEEDFIGVHFEFNN